MSLFVLRHGETAWSRDRKHTGRSDIPLLEEGRTLAQQAGAILERLHAQPWSLVLTSPLVRARDTARLAGFPAAEIDDRLREWDYGAYEGRTSDEIRTETPDWFLWSDGVPDGEGPADVAARVDALLDERVRPELGDGDVLLVAHSHLLRVLAARWLGLGVLGAAYVVLDPAGIGVLGEEHGRPTLLNWNVGPSVMP
ncbi:MAG TPA: histidine phosphatase family protein [Mycobacteriales bacterium]